MPSFISLNKISEKKRKVKHSQYNISHELCRLWDWISRKLKSWREVSCESTVCNKQAHNNTQLKSSLGIGCQSLFTCSKNHKQCAAMHLLHLWQPKLMHNILPNPFITHPSTELPINTHCVIYDSTLYSFFMKIIYCYTSTVSKNSYPI